MYKAFHQLLPYNYKGILLLNLMNMVLKPQKKNVLLLSYVRTTKKQRCISVAGMKLWNSINNNFWNSYSVLRFKKIMKTNAEYHVSKFI